MFALPCVEPEDEAPAEAQGDSALTAALAAIDPDALTPREALEQLYQLKRLTA
jgi:DNA mismatch repair protein MutS